MTAATGKSAAIAKGTAREEDISSFGDPVVTRTKVSEELTDRLWFTSYPISYLDIHHYRGKLNSADEGSGQAIVNALTLGTAEAIMIPLTAVDIVARSFGNHEIFVFYNKNNTVEDVLINPHLAQ